MSTRTWWWIIVGLLLIIIALLVLLIVVPAPARAPMSSGTKSAASSTPADPLHDHVVVTTPARGASVGSEFAVSGEAPGQWYFEAVFPIKVVDAHGDTLADALAHATSDWMTTAQVPFTADVRITAGYTGPAALTLMRDNPSGLPQLDDSLTIPIVIR